MKQIPLIVIIGAGFGGLRLARKLADIPAHILLLDRHNFHLFQPLLYQVATAGLAPEDIASPVRSTLRTQKNLDFRMTEVNGCDLRQQILQTDTGEIHYDYLVLAMGGTTNYFGMANIAERALSLKDLNDAILVRNQILHMFERADHTDDPLLRQALLTFVVVGGGATGVESAGALSELVQKVFVKDYHRLRREDVHIILLEASNRLLSGMPDESGLYAAAALQKKGVDVRLNARVIDFSGKQAFLSDQSVIPCHTLIWAAGVQAAPLTQEIESPKGSLQRLIVTPSLQLPGHDNVFALGDTAYFSLQEEALPMIAPVAVQQADLIAVNLKALIQQRPLQLFSYQDPGMLATIGRNCAVARMGKQCFCGFFAWILWLAIHIIRLIGFRNRIIVLINWTWDYFLYERSIRLITPDLCPRTRKK